MGERDRIGGYGFPRSDDEPLLFGRYPSVSSIVPETGLAPRLLSTSVLLDDSPFRFGDSGPAPPKARFDLFCGEVEPFAERPAFIDGNPCEAMVESVLTSDPARCCDALSNSGFGSGDPGRE
jgi:hypothetical protein